MAQTYPDTPFQRWLDKRCACHEARAWIGERTPQQAWDECPDLSWMDWFAHALGENANKEAYGAGPGARVIDAETERRICALWCKQDDTRPEDARAILPTLPEFIHETVEAQ